MNTENQSKQIADNLINWFRHYASHRLDSCLADAQCCFPPHVFLDLGHQGFFGMHVPSNYGGLGLKTYEILQVIEQLAATDLSLSIVILESIQGAHTLENYASPIY